MEELRNLFSPLCEKSKATKKSKLLAENHAHALALELCSVSTFSPGTVSNQEIVARQIFSPIHLDEEDNTIKAAAFDDVSNKGLSVNRLSYTNEETIHSTGQAKASNDNNYAINNGQPSKANRSYIGYIVANVAEIRNYQDENHRIYAVYDSSLELAIEHADVCMIKHDTINPNGSKWVKMFRRKKLQEMFSELVVPSIN